MTVLNGEFFDVVVRTTLPLAKEALNVFNVRFTSPLPGTDAAFKSNVQGWLSSMYGEAIVNMDTNCTVADAAISQIGLSGNVVRVLGTVAINLAGTIAGDVAPLQIAGLGTAFTDVPRRRGRKYLPGFSEAVMVEGLLTAPALARLTAFVGKWLAGPGPASFIETGVRSGPVVWTFTPFNNTGRSTNAPKTIRNRGA